MILPACRQNLVVFVEAAPRDGGRRTYGALTLPHLGNCGAVHCILQFTPRTIDLRIAELIMTDTSKSR
jgi:hypothetical protein